MAERGISASAVKRALTWLKDRDPAVATALERFGYPPARAHPDAGFASLLRIIVGQQLSIRAAATIYSRVVSVCGDPPLPNTLLAQNDDTLRSAGLSARKVEYAQGLAEAVLDGRLDCTTFPHRHDDEVIASIVALRGFGVWSAKMYLIAVLGRMDVWPTEDLGVRAGAQKILELKERPTEKSLKDIGERSKPYRSAVALLAWHACHATPLTDKRGGSSRSG